MKKLFLVALPIMLFALGFAADQACASDMVVHAGFAFVAGVVTLPAGEYLVETYLPSQILIRIRNTDTGEGAIFPILARLNWREAGGAQAVFSKDGEQYHLSAVYMPGIDGFQLKAVSKKDNVVTTASMGR
jgi:hypothetical protein